MVLKIFLYIAYSRKKHYGLLSGESKKGVDKYQKIFMDLPGYGGYVGLMALASKSLNEQRNRTAA